MMNSHFVGLAMKCQSFFVSLWSGNESIRLNVDSAVFC